jgi:hypothetical protein
MFRLTLLIACLTFFGSEQMPSTTDWRGLSPLKSTRLDVERTLGPPDQNIDNGQLMTYRFPGMVVYFYFTSNPNCQQQLPYTSWNVTSDTLTGIDVNLRPQPLVADTDIDLTKYKRVKGDRDLVDRYLYFNVDNSFAIEVGNNYLAGYHYQPGSKQKDLRCEPRNKR